MKRFEWSEWWEERKQKYLISDEPFLDRDRFASLCGRTGLPDSQQRSTFRFRNVRDGAERFIGRSKSGEKPFARIYTRLGLSLIHISEPTRLGMISYAVFCLKKK